MDKNINKTTTTNMEDKDFDYKDYSDNLVDIITYNQTEFLNSSLSLMHVIKNNIECFANTCLLDEKKETYENIKEQWESLFDSIRDLYYDDEEDYDDEEFCDCDSCEEKDTCELFNKINPEVYSKEPFDEPIVAVNPDTQEAITYLSAYDIAVAGFDPNKVMNIANMNKEKTN